MLLSYAELLCERIILSDNSLSTTNITSGCFGAILNPLKFETYLTLNIGKKLTPSSL